MKQQTILLGFEVGTGAPVEIPLRHMAVTGQTQQSGKTTTLEALISRSQGTALTFITKRGERSFPTGRRIQPYFRDRADWQFVTSILDATLQEKNKFLRPWIIKICRTTKSLAEVQRRVRDELRTAKGINAGVYTQLDAYLELIVPEIERADLAETLDLSPGLNVMDVQDFATPMQMLFVQSALDWVNARCDHTTLVVPEAWEFIPQNKATPVKASAETLIRKGAGLGNHIWLDSQDMAGVDNLALRACTVWLIGVQRETNEIRRNLANIPANLKRPSAADVATLERGQFFACFEKTVAKVYVQPARMTEDQARAIAVGAADIDDARPPPAPLPHIPRPRKKQEDEVDAATARALTDENERLKAELAGAEQRGFSRGLETGLRQAGEYWNAAALDMRDAAQKAVDLGNHLSSVARDGRWSLPRGAAKPSSDPEAARAPAAGTHPSDIGSGNGVATDGAPASPRPAADDGGGPPRQGALALLYVLVAAYPLAIETREWAVFAGKSPATAKSGPWYKDIRALTQAGFIVQDGNAFRATPEGIAKSDRQPVNPKDAADIYCFFRHAIAGEVGSAAMDLLRVLAAHRSYRLDREQWALLSGKSVASSKSGPFYGAIGELRDWGLIEEASGAYGVTPKGCAIIEDLERPRADTAEALRSARRSRLEISGRHYDALTRPMSRGELAEKLGISEKSARSGPWYSAIKEMLESGLVAESNDKIYRCSEDLAEARAA